jgi:hypothetical protein
MTYFSGVLKRSGDTVLIYSTHDPTNGVKEMVTKTNPNNLVKSGFNTRFGDHWPGARCGAKTRRGSPCLKPALKNKTRCQLHGGKSTGPRTAEGKAQVIAANTKHGRRSKAHVSRIKAINAELKRITYEMRRGEFLP